MRRLLAIAVFAIAAAAATAASTGVVLAPHVDPPGAPLAHSHVLAAYRLPLFLDVLRARFDASEGLLRPEPLFDAAATFVLAALALLWPRLPRPTLLLAAELAPARIARRQWHGPRDLAPPRERHA